MKPIRKHAASKDRVRWGNHRFEHWSIDNQVYFLTARCRQEFLPLASEWAKAIFWDRLHHWTR